jgi:hypothetical protein
MLALLATACPESDAETIAAWPIGQRDVRLMQLREWMFGPQLANTAQCPQCAERVEWESRISDFLPAQGMVGETGEPLESTTAGEINAAGYEVRFRLPTSRDMAEVMGASGQDALQRLLTRCILSVCRGDRSCEVVGLPDTVLAALSAKMEAMDPQADIRIALTCPQCSHDWHAQFDIADYLWAEIQHWARQTLNAVHRLARTYGWSEYDILALSPVRRQLYLGMIGS